MEGQTKVHSFIEAWINIFIGFAINFTANMYILPLFGFDIHPMQAFHIGLIFTIISLIRSYFIRRYFNAWMIKIHLREAH